MKNYSLKFSVLLIAAILSIVACSDKQLLFKGETTWLSFNIQSAADSSRYYSFIYAEDPQAVVDTVWVKAIISGKTVNHDREITLVQQPSVTTTEDAQPDVHFVAFTNPELKKYYVLPAGKHEVSLPIVVKRDASLQNSDRVLQMEIIANVNFEPGFTAKNSIKLFISDRFAKPVNWNAQTNQDIANYSNELHEFLVTLTEDKWDAAYLATMGYIEPVLYYPYPSLPTYGVYRNIDAEMYDLQYVKHVVSQLKKLLAIDNEKRASQNLPPWNISFK